MWSWIIWSPLILASLKIIPVSEKILSVLTIPVIMIGVYGPLAGALFTLHNENGRGSAKIYLRSFLDFRLGRKAYIFPILIFGGSSFIAWGFPELFGEERLPMLLPSAWTFLPYLLIMILLGGGQEECLYSLNANNNNAKKHTTVTFLDLGSSDIHNRHYNYDHS